MDQGPASQTAIAPSASIIATQTPLNVLTKELPGQSGGVRFQVAADRFPDQTKIKRM
jgi:hypothetical protein